MMTCSEEATSAGREAQECGYLNGFQDLSASSTFRTILEAYLLPLIEPSKTE